jgi:hypothetical protein
MTDNYLTEWLETTIDDSFDLGWTSLDAAKLIVSRMQAEGLVIVKTEPVAWMYTLPDGEVSLVSRRDSWGHPDDDGWTETPLYAALTGRV